MHGMHGDRHIELAGYEVSRFGVTGSHQDSSVFLRREYALARAAAVLVRDLAVTGTRRISFPGWQVITTSRQHSLAAGASRRPRPRASGVSPCA